MSFPSIYQNLAVLSPTRKEQLEAVANRISAASKLVDSLSIIFVCTHNSRRSQLAEIALRTSLLQQKINKIQCYSAGTEVTAFNPRMVKAIRSAGFLVDTLTTGTNPKYQVKASLADPNTAVLFSKRFDDPSLPTSNFIAIMVCQAAAEHCPYIPGAMQRISLSYIDPKMADDTPKEAETYLNKVYEIASEMAYLAKQLNTL